MFALVIEIPGQANSRDNIRESHVRYSELASKHPGILYKHVMQSRDNPNRFFDVMVWAHQDDSEAFGIDPEYQKHRLNMPIRIPDPARSWVSPGYCTEVWEVGSTTSQETEQYLGLFEVTPGKEKAFVAAASAIRDQIKDHVASMILYQNNGHPNQYSIVLQGHTPDDEAKLATLAEYTLRAPEIERGELIVRYDFR